MTNIKNVPTNKIEEVDFIKQKQNINDLLLREDAGLLEDLFDQATVHDLVVDGKTSIRAGEKHIFKHDDVLWYVEKGIGYCTHFSDFADIPQLLRFAKADKAAKRWQLNNVSIMFLPVKGKKQKLLPLVSGDEDTRGAEFEFQNTVEAITVSFECLRRFYGEKTTQKKVAERLFDGTLTIVDYTNDDLIKLTPAESRAIKKHAEAIGKIKKENKDAPLPVLDLKPPKPGYTVVGENWHRSATVVFYDKQKKFSILIGQDEGTYFGVELADNPKTVAAAYISLVPKEIRNKKGIKRQGEWFAVPVAEKDVPKIEECLCEASTSGSDDFFNLSRDSEDSARHYLYAENQIRIGRDGKIYALNAKLCHENMDHADLITNGWNTFCRNTAVRAFSVQGVD